MTRLHYKIYSNRYSPHIINHHPESRKCCFFFCEKKINFLAHTFGARMTYSMHSHYCSGIRRHKYYWGTRSSPSDDNIFNKHAIKCYWMNNLCVCNGVRKLPQRVRFSYPLSDSKPVLTATKECKYRCDYSLCEP